MYNNIFIILHLRNKTHQALDKAVDQCYRKKPFGNERERIEFLFELYEEYTPSLFENK